MDNTSIGDEIRRLRKLRKWSLERLCEEIGISIRTLSRIENNKCQPRTDAWLKLERWLLDSGVQETALAQLRPPISLGWLARKADVPRHMLQRYRHLIDLKKMENEYEDNTEPV